MAGLFPSYMSDKTTISGDGATTFTLASFSLATLTQYLATGKCMYVDIVIGMFDTFSYGSVLGKVILCIDKQTGPVYHLGSVTNSLINNSSGVGNATDAFTNGWSSGITVDQNSGNLRVRAILTSIGVDVWGIANCMGQV